MSNTNSISPRPSARASRLTVGSLNYVKAVARGNGEKRVRVRGPVLTDEHRETMALNARNTRLAQNRTQADVAAEIHRRNLWTPGFGGKPASAYTIMVRISDYERGRVRTLSLEQVAAIETVLGLAPGALFRGIEKPALRNERIRIATSRNPVLSNLKALFRLAGEREGLLIRVSEGNRVGDKILASYEVLSVAHTRRGRHGSTFLNLRNVRNGREFTYDVSALLEHASVNPECISVGV